MTNKGVKYRVRIQTDFGDLWVNHDSDTHPMNGEFAITEHKDDGVRAEWIGYLIQYAVDQGCYGNIFIDRV